MTEWSHGLEFPDENSWEWKCAFVFGYILQDVKFKDIYIYEEMNINIFKIVNMFYDCTHSSYNDVLIVATEAI